MGFSIPALRSSLEFARKGYFDNMENVIDMGSQEIHIKKKDFIEITKSFDYLVNLEEFEDGISPGQACVFYNKDKFGYKVLGGGWIKN